MKNVLIAILVVLTLSLTTNCFAQFTCSKMEPILINTNSVWLKNVSGGVCGTLENNAHRYFLLNPNDTNPLLAILLTTLSLQKVVWVYAVEDIPRGGVISVIAISNNTAPVTP